MSNRTETARADAETPALTDGRYLYCVVRVEAGGASPTLETDGVDDESVSIVTIDSQDGEDSGSRAGLGAVVHACEALYDAADPRLVKGWLVQHQRVVDEATERFGTPIPFQFDTILRGGDGGVKEWLRSERETLRDALDALAGTQEYRIDVVRTEPIPDATIVADDDELQALEAKIDDASEGRAHLLEKRFEQTLASRRRERDRTLAASVEDRIDEFVSALQPLDRTPSVSLGDAGESDAADADAETAGGTESDAADADTETADETTGETVCRFAVLATEAGVDGLGDALDTVADRDGIAVRFTGPWPPYSFVPSFDSDGDEGD